MFFLGIGIHLCFLFSIFDIYFKSPIVKNVTPYIPKHKAVADRLVLFSLDGLRAESFVNSTAMHHLRYIANSHGRWGISHTRPPTESRPGHVAIIAGFYEDPSAVTKGWKENPVDFDSVFNQTAYTWFWGSFDIIQIFTKGSLDNHIFTTKYGAELESFNTDQNTTLFDAWVFDNVRKFFENAKYDKDVYEKLRQKKIAFFLHLLGTDTSGHTHKPKTQEFLTTLKYVDEGIKEIEKIMKDFYDDDGKTTFLMTSDHGMTDWGSHGAGDDHETQTPYVLWGAGVQKVFQGRTDPETNKMSLDHRFDLNQADLTPLMSTILSIPVPVNSIGQLRSDLLNLSLADKAKSIYSNSRQLASQYDKKRSDIEANFIPIFYQPFAPFSKQKYDKMIAFTEDLLKNEHYDKLILFSKEIIDLSLKGLTYYHNYYQRTLLVLVTLSFIGWIVCLLKVLAEQKMSTLTEASSLKTSYLINNKKSFFFSLIFLSLSLISTFVVYAQNLPVQYYIYFLLPEFLWWNASLRPEFWKEIFYRLKRNRKLYKTCIDIACYTIGSLALGLSFTYRWMLSIPLCGMGLWPFMTLPKKNCHTTLLLSWMLSCFYLSVFSFMPVIGKNVFIELVISAGVVWLLMVGAYLWKVLLPLYHNGQENLSEIFLVTIEIMLLALSLHNIYTQSKRFELGTPVSRFYQAMAWNIAIVCFILPLVHSRRLICRLMAIYTSLLNFYLLLSVSHEGLFMVTLIFNVTCWVFLEFRLLHLDDVKINFVGEYPAIPGNRAVWFVLLAVARSLQCGRSLFLIVECAFDKEKVGGSSKNIMNIERSINDQDFRRAFFFITYITLAFFGTGNVASMNSFELRWVTCFITSYKPFIITGLILLKTLTPFLIVACCFKAVQYLTKAPIGILNTIVLIYSNIIGIQLLYFVKNTGSWLEIGTSISQFVIVQVITLFIVLINQLAKILTNVNIYNFANEVFKIRKKYV